MRLLVRHAHAGDKRQWRGPDADRPLSVRGWGEAEGLGEVLAGVRVERLLSSPSLRCRQTLLPLAATLGLAVEATDDLGLDGDADHLADRLTAGDGDGVALCTHGEVLGALLARLRARGVIQAEGRLPYEKGSTWALEVLEEGRYRARYLPPRVADPARARRGGGARAELGRLAVEQQRLLGSVAMLASRTRRRAARPGPQLAALEAQRAAVASQLDQVREAAGALAGAQARLAATEGPPGRLHHAAPQPPARMVAGLTDAGAVLVAAAGRLARRDPDRQWAVLAEQPLAVRAEPGEVERLMVALLDAAGATLPPAGPTWVIARAARAGAVVGIATDPALLPLDGLPPSPPGRGPRGGASSLGQAGQLAAGLGGELTASTGGPAAALLLRFPLAAPPDDVWPDQPPFQAAEAAPPLLGTAGRRPRA